ncbi:class I SAM-dependent methyltransferase [Reyranella sp.]|uniref:class I SAM-dependent methyltransferase n=1 Tax=Reyranella sp. TaxID=1929291 RepID=UPI003C7A49DD
MKAYDAASLDTFVAEVDRLGGVESPLFREAFATFSYRPGIEVDQLIDPLSEDYVEQQVRLYREISGRDLNQADHELTQFDLEAHVAAANPYASPYPSGLALHHLRLATALHLARLGRSPRLLDMGAGWGLSTEFFAGMGCRTTAVDINPSFVELIRRRQQRSNLAIEALQGSFDDFEPSSSFDAVCFYECLHHAVRPWRLIERVRSWLREGGKLLLAGEPFNDLYWKNWGLRLDPLSVYCIRKFGWYESGWSLPFLTACLNRSGFSVETVDIPIEGAGIALIATKIAGNALHPAKACPVDIAITDSMTSGDFLTLAGSHEIAVENGEAPQVLSMHVRNHRPKDVVVSISATSESRTHTISPGPYEFRLKLRPGLNAFSYQAETWVPALELGNDDRRPQSVHIAGWELLRA